MRFTWDPRKAAANLKKHRVSFEEAGTAPPFPPSANHLTLRNLNDFNASYLGCSVRRTDLQKAFNVRTAARPAHGNRGVLLVDYTHRARGAGAAVLDAGQTWLCTSDVSWPTSNFAKSAGKFSSSRIRIGRNGFVSRVEYRGGPERPPHGPKDTPHCIQSAPIVFSLRHHPAARTHRPVRANCSENSSHGRRRRHWQSAARRPRVSAAAGARVRENPRSRRSAPRR